MADVIRLVAWARAHPDVTTVRHHPARELVGDPPATCRYGDSGRRTARVLIAVSIAPVRAAMVDGGEVDIAAGLPAYVCAD